MRKPSAWRWALIVSTGSVLTASHNRTSVPKLRI